MLVQALHPEANLPGVRLLETDLWTALHHLPRRKPGRRIELIKTELSTRLDACYAPSDLLVLHHCPDVL